MSYHVFTVVVFPGLSSFVEKLGNSADFLNISGFF